MPGPYEPAGGVAPSLSGAARSSASISRKVMARVPELERIPVLDGLEDLLSRRCSHEVPRGS